MDRRDFMKMSGIGLGALMLPIYGRSVAAEVLLSKMDAATKKKLADVALGAAKANGATYCDVRIGRYLRQFVITREDKVQNVVNTESSGIGVRVIANGTWGFAATSDMDSDSVARAVKQAIAIAKANSRLQSEPVQLAPTKGVGEVSWATPIQKNSMEVPIKEKVDLLLDVNAAAMANGANFIRSILFLVNEQKYFASSDGSYVDQDIHRIWAPTQVTAVDQKSGKFRTRDGLSAPRGMGYEYLDPKPQHRIALPGGAVGYDDEGIKTQRWDLIKDGVLVNYQVIRDQAHILGLDHSQGCCYADSWSSVQFQRMANVSLAPGKDALKPEDMIKNVENGIYIIGDGSFSIDQQRYNAQFGGQLFYEIKNGKVTQMLEDVAYQIRTPEFWNSCVGVCDDKDYRFGGSFFDGKGQPGQISAVSHGSSTARFNGANVINTARSLG
ncbi:MAG TPA: TldD/PmbA family protein [Rhodanobacteraceae bacterium]|nr:TldD/PmbA family protein [Rhodanobacteraceae bacterium]